MFKFVFFLTVILLAVYLIVLVALYTFQDRLVFPAPGKISIELPSEAEILKTEVADGIHLEHVRLPNKDGSPKVMFFHGNGSIVPYEMQRGLELHRLGFDVLLVEYRGYGGNPGQPSAADLLADSLKVHDRYVDESDSQVFLYAHSLGAGIATYIASQRKVAALALEASYASLAEVAADHYPVFPVRYLFKNEINSLSFVQNIEAPMLLIHGETDRVIPIEHGEKLFAGIKSQNKKWVQLPEAGHNNLLGYGSIERVIEFFKQVGNHSLAE